MTDTLAIRFTSDEGAVRRCLGDEASVDVTTMSQLPLRPRRLARMRLYERLALVGLPPREGIGFGFTPVVAAMLRPRTVTTIDIEGCRRSTQGGTSYVLRNALPGMLQVIASVVAVILQVVLAGAVRLASPEQRRDPTLARVLYLRPLVGMATAVGGSVTHAHEVIRELRDIGVAVVPVTTDDQIARTALLDPDPPCRWHVVRVPWILRALPASFALGGDAALLIAALRHRRGVCAVYQRHTRFSLVGALVSHVLRRPLFLEFNSPSDFFRPGPAPPMTRLRRACEATALAAATRVVVVSDVAKRQVVARGISEDRVVVAPNGVNAARFGTGGGQRVRAMLGIAEDEVVFGFIGSFGSWHGAPVLARAFVQLARELDSVRLLLVGDGEELIEVHGTLTALLHDGRVLSQGRVDPSHIPDLLDACDVFVSPHVPLPNGVEFFGSPTKLFEYMAAGKAIVASRLGQIADVLENEETALLVEPGNEAALAAALLRVATDEELRVRLGKAARREAEAGHSWHRNAQRILAAFEQLPIRGE